MNERIKELWDQAAKLESDSSWEGQTRFMEKFARLIIEETLNEVDERVYSRGENQWYYDVDKKWIRLHFGYGELHDEVVKK